MKKIVGIFVSIFCITSVIITYNSSTANSTTTYITGVVSNSSTQINQSQKIVWIDLDQKKVVKEMPLDNVGHGSEASISPNKKLLAKNKWINRMDLNLFLVDLQNKKETQLTTDINGEIKRISWIDDHTLLYSFDGHDSKKFGSGMYIYTYDINTKSQRPFFKNQPSNNSQYRYNTVRYISGLDKVIYSQIKADDYFKSFALAKAAPSQLYWCDKTGDNIQKLTEIENKTIGRVVPTFDNKKLIIEAYYMQGGAEKSDLYLYDIENKKTSLLLASNEQYPEHWNIVSPMPNTVWFRSKRKLYELNMVNKKIQEVKLGNINKEEEVVGFDVGSVK